jgi:hypothetical protein
MKVVRLLCLALTVSALCSPAQAQTWTNIYTQYGPLTAYSLTFEPNPGISGPYPTTPTQKDVLMQTTTADGQSCSAVTANDLWDYTYVNALAYYKMITNTPDGQPIRLKTYRYIFAIQLPRVPSPNQSDPYNAQSAEMSIQFWDGSNTLWQANKRQVEATVYWDLNPWDSHYGEFYVYTANLQLYDTGIHVTPDTNWHVIDLRADLANRIYAGMSVDTRWAPLTNLSLLLRSHPDWGGGVSLSLTAESMNCYPGAQDTYNNQWTTDFKDVKLFRLD